MKRQLERLVGEFDLPEAAPGQFEALLEALAAEPDPHTTVSSPQRALDVHVRDSLVALCVDELRSASRIADLGAGAGFPGLPLAIALPHARVDLIEAAKRKCVVIERLTVAAGIANARPVQARAEDWAAAEGQAAYDLVTARAVGPLNLLVEYAAPLLRVGGSLVAWKGSPDPAEIESGTHAATVVGLDPCPVVPVTPFEGARRLTLYVYSKVRETPGRFPRRPGMAAKRPLVAENSPTQP